MLGALPGRAYTIPSEEHLDILAKLSIHPDLVYSEFQQMFRYGLPKNRNRAVLPKAREPELTASTFGQLLSLTLDPTEALTLAMKEQDLAAIGHLLDLYAPIGLDTQMRDPQSQFSMIGVWIRESGFRGAGDAEILEGVRLLKSYGFSLATGAEEGRCALSAAMIAGGRNVSLPLLQSLVELRAAPERVSRNGGGLAALARQASVPQNILSALEFFSLKSDRNSKNEPDSGIGL